MGVRPTFYTLVGIDDATPDDPRRFTTDIDWEFLLDGELPQDKMWKSEDGMMNDWRDFVHIPGKSRGLYHIVYNYDLDDEWTLGNVIGYICHHGPHDDDFVRALATIDKKYLSSGWERIPTLDPIKHNIRYRRNRYTEEDVANNMFVEGFFESMPSLSRERWSRAQHYLKLCGWNIPKTDLRYLLVWNWS